jgi:chaperonin GroEL (HSP60 family)
LNAETGKIEDLIKAGIIDPVKVIVMPYKMQPVLQV